MFIFPDVGHPGFLIDRLQIMGRAAFLYRAGFRKKEICSKYKSKIDELLAIRINFFTFFSHLMRQYNQKSKNDELCNKQDYFQGTTN